MKIERVVLLLAIYCSLVAWYISYRLGFVLTYNDAASHLDIARRVFDNLTPGLAQIGTVWLPLPHLLMMFFVWNDFLWHTALAGSIISILSFIVSVVFVFKTIIRVTQDKWAAFIGSLVVLLNPNLLYLQTTPMTEPLLLALFSVSTYLLVRYIGEPKTENVALLGAAVALASLTRYDGWFLFLTILIILPFWNLVYHNFRRAEGTLFLYLPIGGFGVFLWLLWNLTIFGHPLYFMFGPYSAYAQQRILHSVGQLPTEGHLGLSIFYYFSSMVVNDGLLILILSAIAIPVCLFLVKRKLSIPLLLVALSPLVFNILSLYLGQSAMNVPQALTNPGLFNIRYGLMVLPALAVLIGILASFPLAKYFIVLFLIIQSVIFINQGPPVTLKDGLIGLKNTLYTVEGSSWLRSHYQGGLILISLASHDAFVARTGLPMKDYIHEGNRDMWNSALRGPNPNIQYIALLSYPPDIVYRSLKDNSDFKQNYSQVYNYGFFEIFKRTK